jgi:hypothetical protein
MWPLDRRAASQADAAVKSVLGRGETHPIRGPQRLIGEANTVGGCSRQGSSPRLGHCVQLMHAELAGEERMLACD